MCIKTHLGCRYGLSFVAFMMQHAFTKKIPESIYTLYVDHDTQHCLILVNTYSKIMNSAQSDLNALVITLKLHDKVYSYILHIVPPADYSLNVVYLRQMLMPA